MLERKGLVINRLDITRKGEKRADPGRPRPLADAVLHLIWKERSLSRADIARQAGLSRSTVSEIVGEILPSGLVAEVGSGKSSGGRRPILLEFQDASCVILGVEMGAAHVCVALTDLRGNVLSWICRDHPVRKDPVGTRQVIAELCELCLDPQVVQNRPLVGIGVAAPCPVDPNHPEQLSQVVMPAWGGRLGLEDLGRQHRVPVMVDNDANLGALAELWWGDGRGLSNFTYIKVSTGIGAGHVMGGEIYRGATGVAGEIGHLVIDPHGKTCVCGLHGCLATLVGKIPLVERAGELLPDFGNSRLIGKDLTIEIIEEAALAGDHLALKVVKESAENLAIALAGLLNIINPEKVIVGGQLATLGGLLVEPLQATIQKRTLGRTGGVAGNISVSQLGEQSIALGAATLVLKAALHESRHFPVFTGGEVAQRSARA